MTSESNGSSEREDALESKRRKAGDGVPDGASGTGQPGRGTTARKLGLGAAAGAGAIAAASLLGSDQHVTGASATHASSSPPTAPVSEDGDQGSVPLPPADTLGENGRADPSPALDGLTSTAGDPSGGGQSAAPSRTVPKTDPGMTLLDGSTGAPPGQTVSDTYPPATGGTDPHSLSRTWTDPNRRGSDPGSGLVDPADITISGAHGGGPPQANDGLPSMPTVPLYDSSGQPVGTLDSTGHFTAFKGNRPGAESSSPQVLYDDAGRPTALMNDSGDVVPYPVGNSSDTLFDADSSLVEGSPTTNGSIGARPNSTAPNQFTNISGHPNNEGSGGSNSAQSGYDIASMTDEQKFIYAPWVLSEDAKSQIVQNSLNKNNVALPPGVSDYLPDLGDNFFSQNTYQLTDSHHKKVDADLLSVAATAYVMAAEIVADIMEQTKLAKDLESVAETIWGSWAEKIMNINIDSVFDGDPDLEEFKYSCQSTLGDQKQATRIAIDGIYDMGDALKKAASAYFAVEQENLKQFNLTAKDPRSLSDQREYVNGEDKYAYYKRKMRNLDESMD